MANAIVPLLNIDFGPRTTYGVLYRIVDTFPEKSNSNIGIISPFDSFHI